MDFRSEEEIDHFLHSFHTGALPRYCWTHAAHIAMCVAVLWTEDSQHVDHIRQGIHRYNASHGTPAAAYHETLTRFWIETVQAHILDAQPGSRLEAVRGAIKTFGPDSSLPRKRYTFDVFTSDRARMQWIPPDA